MRRTMTCALLGALVIGLFTAPAANAEGSFYDPPEALPAGNGGLVRSEPMELRVNVDIDDVVSGLPGTATRIMYRTTDATGAPAAVTGVYIEPTVAWSGGGPRPLVSYAVGTQGQGDSCAPSYSLESAVVIDEDDFALSAGYEALGIYGFLRQGVAVVMTDYVGLGTTDRLHTYVNRVDEGHAVLDAVRAAYALPDTSITTDSPVGFYGYSQGGGAAASAAELAETYAPELDVVGTYAGAPPADLAEVMVSADRTALTGVIGWALNGLVQYDPALEAALEGELSANGRAVLDDLATRCIGDLIIASGTAFDATRSWTTSGSSLAQVTARVPAAKAAVDAQRIGTMKPNAPVMVLTGTKDDIVAHGQAKQLAQDWCSLGANVRYVPIPQATSSLGTAVNHLGPMLTQRRAATSWLIDRLEGDSAVSNCWAVGILP